MFRQHHAEGTNLYMLFISGQAFAREGVMSCGGACEEGCTPAVGDGYVLVSRALALHNRASRSR